jgi:riboflavin kinase/FMN adenylyltransferase
VIFRGLDQVGAGFGPCVLTIGNFDGVHAGHRQIFRRVVELAHELGVQSAAITFDPHPARIVAPERAPHLLNSPDERARMMEDLGIENVLILRFDRDFSHLTPEEFIRQVLVEKLKVRAVLVGCNFHFGGGQAGTVETLRTLGEKYGFRVESIDGVIRRGRLVSSTVIRKLIEAGNVSLACRFLERPYAVQGQVVAGHGIGARQTVPTLNLGGEFEVLPARGVYITRTHEAGGARSWPSITNVGVRPTFGGSRLTVETYLLSPLEAPAPKRISVEFLRRVREERKFDSPEALKSQILKDVSRAKAYFRRLDRFRVGPPVYGKIGY